ncbi:MAG: RHS repeat-associated core domain-containing protein [Steroidobacteraceae bacterium]
MQVVFCQYGNMEMNLRFVCLLVLSAVALFFLPETSSAAACDVQSIAQDPTHEHVVGACPTYEAALQACQSFSDQYSYPGATWCHHGNYSLVWEAGWLCKAGLSNHQNCGPVGYALGDFYHPHYFASVVPPTKSQCGSSCNGVGDPINPAGGGVYATEIDAAGQGNLQTFKRFYNSLDDSNGDLGKGWRHSFSRNVKYKYSTVSYKEYSSSPDNSSIYSDPASACTSGFNQIKSRVSTWQSATVAYVNGVCSLSQGGVTIGAVPLLAYFDSDSGLPASFGSNFAGTNTIGFDVTRDDGQVISFMLSGGSVVAPPGFSLKLQQTASGFTLTDASDSVETYDSAGKLLSIADRTGVIQTINYDSLGRLSLIVDTFGHTISLVYGTSGKLASVIDSDGQSIQYSYDTVSRLATVVTLDGTSRAYLYENTSFPNAMTGLVDENGNRLSTWVYDSQGRGTQTYEAGGAGNHTLVYNTDGTVTVTDALGAVRTFNFGRYGDRNLVTGISGSQCPTCSEGKATTYDLRGWVSSRTDYNNNVTTYVYDDDRGLELSRTEGYGTAQARTITTQWHATYRLPLLVTEPGRTTGYSYDASGNMLSKTLTDTVTNTARTWSYTYNSYGQVLTADGPRTDVSDVTAYTYYTCNTGGACGQLQTVTNALGQTTTYNTYNAAGQPLTITDANGVVTTLTYDLRQRLTSRTVGSEATGFEYWPTGLLKKVTLPDSSTLTYSYDNAHRLTGITDSDGNRIAYTLDAAGNRTQEQVLDASNAVVRTRSRVFNTLSRLVQELGANSQSTSYSYDNNGNLASLTDPASRTTSYGYDALNRLVSQLGPASQTTGYGYDAQDNLTSVTDPKSLTTSYTYNGLGDLKQLSSPDTGVTQYTHDSAGNLNVSTDARTKSGTYSYDASGRVTQIQYSDQTQTFQYDQGTNGKGHLTQFTDGSGSTSYTYDGQGHIIGKTQTIGSQAKTVSYGYINGNLTSIQTPSGQTISYSYANGRISGINVNGATVLNTLVYQPFGQTEGWTWGNGSLTVRQYDQDGQITLVDSAGLSTYTYNPDGTIATRTDDSSTNLGLPTGLTTFGVSTTSNKLNSATGTLSRTYSYDNAGNTLSDGAKSFTYNDAGRMVSSNFALTTTYQYNSLGQRVQKSNSNGTTNFVYDESGHLLGEYSSSGTLIQELVWLNDIPVATIRTDQGGTSVGVFYVHTDHLNSPTKVTRATNNEVIWRWDHDPYGNGTPNEDPDGNGLRLSMNLRYPGQYYDAETSLNYNMARDYDPATGRYVESDPIGLDGGINTYAYVGGNPISNIDPTGEFIAGIAIGALFEIGLQAVDNYKKGCDLFDYHNYDWWDVGVSAAVGAVAPGWFKVGKTAGKSGGAVLELTEQLGRARTTGRVAKVTRRIKRHGQDFRDMLLTQSAYQLYKVGAKAMNDNDDCSCQR